MSCLEYCTAILQNCSRKLSIQEASQLCFDSICVFTMISPDLLLKLYFIHPSLSVCRLTCGGPYVYVWCGYVHACVHACNGQRTMLTVDHLAF